eukprot:scaffold208_cov63-Attheya_sp.AAC.4
MLSSLLASRASSYHVGLVVIVVGVVVFRGYFMQELAARLMRTEWYRQVAVLWLSASHNWVVVVWEGSFPPWAAAAAARRLQGSFAPCKGAWYGSCFKPRGHETFPIRAQFDDDGDDVIVEPGVVNNFMQAHTGDHLMTPFQCDKCHFQNIMGRNPSMLLELRDSKILEFSQRVTLDAFWDQSLH